MFALLLLPTNGFVTDFIGALYRIEDTANVTISWDPNASANGTQLRIVHFFYDIREPVVEVDHSVATQYTFQGLPKSSRHFAIEVRSIRDISAAPGDREYSGWVLSTDSAVASVDGQALGWLIYTKPAGAGGIIIQ